MKEGPTGSQFLHVIILYTSAMLLCACTTRARQCACQIFDVRHVCWLKASCLWRGSKQSVSLHGV
jgi:hypothetical protein